MGSKYPCHDHSFILGNHIFRSVNLSFNKPISIYRLLATWLASTGAKAWDLGQFSNISWAYPSNPISLGSVSGRVANEVVQDQSSEIDYLRAWGVKLTLTGIVASMAVNALVTGLIVFKIFKVFLEVKATRTSVERTLGSTGGTKFRHVIFVIIESGMALFAIQLVRVGLLILPVQSQPISFTNIQAVDLVIGINEMLNVITRSVHFYFLLFY